MKKQRTSALNPNPGNQHNRLDHIDVQAFRRSMIANFGCVFPDNLAYVNLAEMKNRKFLERISLSENFD